MKREIIQLIVLVLLIGKICEGRPFTLDVIIKNQPDNPIVLGSIRGDTFTPIDTVVIRTDPIQNAVGSEFTEENNPLKSVRFILPEHLAAGMYRLVMGQTTYARVMGESPQQIDFIFNKENIIFETDFRAPEESLKVVQSEENQVWFGFLKKENEYRQQLNLLEKEVNYFQERMNEVKSSAGIDRDNLLRDMEGKAAKTANEFNRLQMERERFISQIIKEDERMFASRLIRIFKEPFRDGYLSDEERKLFFQRDYFRDIDFSDTPVVYTPVLTDKIFNYLTTYNRREYNREQRELAYIRAVDVVMQNIEKTYEGEKTGSAVFEFILNYLVSGFEKLNMNTVLVHIADTWSGKICQTDESTTLARKLKAQKMEAGTIVPDFTLNDLNGHSITFSGIAGSLNLIIFWASWCPHCNELLPQIRSWHSQHNGREVKIIAISLDTSHAEWKEAVMHAGFDSFINVSDLMKWDGKVSVDYNIYATPTMFLVDHNREIISKPITFRDLIQVVGK